jgi:GT2 family glycosyltransferase
MGMAGAQVLTIILNYKTADMTLDAAEACLRELDGIDGSLTIVDNDSQDGSFETLSTAAEERGWTKDNRVRVMQSGVNGGFGAGNNFGIRAGLPDGSRPDYVYILNSDAFPDPGAVRKLVDYLDAHPKVGFVGSYIHGPDTEEGAETEAPDPWSEPAGAAHQTAFRYPSAQSELEGAARTGPISKIFRKYIVALPLPDVTTEVDWLAGASIMMRQDVLDEIGLFDETFFLYFEETDLCRRAHLAGWPTVYVRDSEVTHIGSVSTGMKEWKRMPSYWFDSRMYYFRKNHGAFYAAVATIAHITGGLIWRLRCLIQRKPVNDPKNFLRDLTGHAIMSVFRPKKTKPTPHVPVQANISGSGTP